jgi:hypothetical protein
MGEEGFFAPRARMKAPTYEASSKKKGAIEAPFLARS